MAAGALNGTSGVVGGTSGNVGVGGHGAVGGASLKKQFSKSKDVVLPQLKDTGVCVCECFCVCVCIYECFCVCVCMIMFECAYVFRCVHMH